MSGGNRKARVAAAIRDTLSEMIAREVKDPRVAAAGVVSITQVDLNADLTVATVYVSIYGDDRRAEAAIAGLRGAAGFLRGPLGRRLRLVKPPELRFRRDTGMEFGLELARIVREDEARAREREAAEAPSEAAEGESPAPGEPPPAGEGDDHDA